MKIAATELQPIRVERPEPYFKHHQTTMMELFFVNRTYLFDNVLNKEAALQKCY